jgi:hypothetical protein
LFIKNLVSKLFDIKVLRGIYRHIDDSRDFAKGGEGGGYPPKRRRSPRKAAMDRQNSSEFILTRNSQRQPPKLFPRCPSAF